MKKLMVFIAVIALAMSGLAQDALKDPSMSNPAETKVSKGDYVKMQDGKVWFFQNGKNSMVTKEIKLGGTTVMPDGQVIMKGGKKDRLEEGDIVNSDGSLTKALKKVSEPPKDEMPKY